MLADDSPVPSGLDLSRFVATPLTADVAVLDYAAYMASPDVIRVHSDGRWPLDGFTLADDRRLVAKHQADHENRRAFTFLLLTPARDEALGCLYPNPLNDYLRRVGATEDYPAASAMVTFWLRQDQQDTGLAEAVTEAVNDWLTRDWPFETFLFRILPAEASSRAALERLKLTRVALSRPYLWYQRDASAWSQAGVSRAR